MKNVKIISAILLLVMTGCGGKKQTSDEIITVDVTTSYPKKELILQDFMDVEYIPLETGGEFYTQGIVLAIGKEYILIRNQVRDGNIFIFDRTGKGVRKFNRMGQGSEEYLLNYDVFLDEDSEEIFVCDNSIKKIMVYDLFGTFKRYIRINENARYSDLYNYDNKHFIWWNSAIEYKDDAASIPSFFISSKQDGNNVKEIKIPFKHRKSTVVISRNEETNMTNLWSTFFSSIIPFRDEWVFVEPSSDTIYRFLPDHSMRPFIVRTPSVQSMTPEVFLFPGILTDRYYFMETQKKELNFETMEFAPSIKLMYDKEEKAIFEYTVYNDDYSNNRRVEMLKKTKNNEIATYQRLTPDLLVRDYEKGHLKGRLKEIAAKFAEDNSGIEPNPVIMLVKYKR